MQLWGGGVVSQGGGPPWQWWQCTRDSIRPIRLTVALGLKIKTFNFYAVSFFAKKVHFLKFSRGTKRTAAYSYSIPRLIDTSDSFLSSQAFPKLGSKYFQEPDTSQLFRIIVIIFWTDSHVMYRSQHNRIVVITWLCGMAVNTFSAKARYLRLQFSDKLFIHSPLTKIYELEQHKNYAENEIMSFA